MQIGPTIRIDYNRLSAVETYNGNSFRA